MNNLVPTKLFLTKGVGQHKYRLKSFEEALRKAGVAQQNLVQVSSILPPKCKVISREKGLQKLIPGEICYCVLPLIASYVYHKRSWANKHSRKWNKIFK